MPASQNLTSSPGVRTHEGTGVDRRWLTLALLATAQFMVVLDASIVNIAIPHIATGLHTALSTLAWVITAYVVAFGGLLPFGGRLADLLGRRRTFLVGLGIFTLASLAAGLAPSIGSLSETAQDTRPGSMRSGLLVAVAEVIGLSLRDLLDHAAPVLQGSQRGGEVLSSEVQFGQPHVAKGHVVLALGIATVLLH